MFLALAASERFLPCVPSHVLLQFVCYNAIIVALVTPKWFFSCMLPHRVNFQITTLIAGKLAHCAFVTFFTWVGPFVPHKRACTNWGIVALVALVYLFPSVFHNVLSETSNKVGWIVALCALVQFFSSMGEPVIGKAISTCKCLGTQVTRPSAPLNLSSWTEGAGLVKWVNLCPLSLSLDYGRKSVTLN